MGTKKRIIERINKRMDFINEEPVREKIIELDESFKDNVKKFIAGTALVGTCLGASCTKMNEPSYLYKYYNPTKSDSTVFATSFIDFDEELNDEQLAKLKDIIDSEHEKNGMYVNRDRSYVAFEKRDVNDEWRENDTDKWFEKNR